MGYSPCGRKESDVTEWLKHFVCTKCYSRNHEDKEDSLGTKALKKQ